jgi:hypothetical protein
VCNIDRKVNAIKLSRPAEVNHMMMRQRYLFPYLYIIFLFPLFLGSTVTLQASVFGACLILALSIRRQTLWNIAPVMLASVGTLTPFLIVVEWAVCSSAGLTSSLSTFDCVWQRSVEVLLKVGLGASVLLLAASNEWRGSLVETSNSMWLPRSVRTIVIVAGVMIGEFRKAMIRVHHAFTARGEAFPALHWRNLVALPQILVCVWGSVLRSSSERLDAQWSSQVFWDRFVPAKQRVESNPLKMATSDFAVIIAAGFTVALMVHFI